MISGTRYKLTLEINRQLSLARSIERAQIEISTKKRIQTASDDPVAAARVSDIARAQANEATWKSNLDLAAALSARADTTIKAAVTAMDRVNELVLIAKTGTTSPEGRATIALELRSIAEELTALKDTKDSRGGALFMSGISLEIPVAAGIAMVAVPTREEVFETVPTAGGPQDLAAIVTAAANAVELPDATRAAAVEAALIDVGSAMTHIQSKRAEQGARGNRFDQLLERQADTGLQLTEERSALEDTNIIETTAKLQARQLTLDAAQAVFARVNQNTLFDLLR